MGKWYILFIAGGIGTITRYFVSGISYEFLGAEFPVGTLIINLLGCFLIGFLAAISEEKFLMSPEMRLFLMVGFLGAFTTFSTFMLETANLIKAGQTFLAFGNVLLSVVAGFLLFRLGVLLGEII